MKVAFANIQYWREKCEEIEEEAENRRKSKLPNRHKCCQPTVPILNRVEIESNYFFSSYELTTISTVILSGNIPLPFNLTIFTTLD